MTTPLRDRLQAALGAGFSLGRELGGGGMSHVFVARDVNLERELVVKVLPPDAAATVSAERFQREIAVVARLQHPNIVPLLSAGVTADGLPFYTMPLVEGESLRDRLSRSGELPVAEAVAVLRDVGRALAYAHSRGVLHRDIKPDNVLLSGGTAVVTDFGVARALSAEPGATRTQATAALTETGVALGTPAYMAPEQVSGEEALDQRVDLYALGCLAYELLCGRPPFMKATSLALLTAHVVETPEPIANRRPGVPAPLASLVMQCLEKRADDRPSSAEAVLQALELLHLPAVRTSRRWALGVAVLFIVAAVAFGARRMWTGAARADLSSIAVMPFENTSRDTAVDYLADGIVDEVRDGLRGVPGLAVKARSSSRQLRAHEPRDVGARLGVATVLQGTVSRAKSRLHITAELIRVSTENVLWSATFDTDANDLAQIQDAIVHAVSDSLRPRVAASASSGARRNERGTQNAEAYYAFLRGRYAADRFDWDAAIRAFAEAVHLDPGFARAYGNLAVAYANGPTLGTLPVDSMNALSEAAARHALALDPSVADAYLAQSLVLVSALRLDASLVPLEKARQLDPTNSDILSDYGAILGQLGEPGEGLRRTALAYQLDPLSPSTLGIHGYLLTLAGPSDSARFVLRSALAADPRNAVVAQGLGLHYAFRQQRDSAVKYLELAFQLAPDAFDRRGNLVFARALEGRWSEAAAERARMARDPSGNSPNYLRMMAALVFGEHDAAMTALERSVAERESLAGVASIPCDPLFNPLKGDPRYAAVVRRIGATHVCPASLPWPIPPRSR